MKKMMIGISLALLALAGCRLKDEKEFVVEVPTLTQANMNEIRNALTACTGVDASTLKFDLENHSVTVRYDSMQTAKANILFAIAKTRHEAFTELKNGSNVVTNSVKPEDVVFVTNSTSNARR